VGGTKIAESDIYIPTVEEIARSDPYGLLWCGIGLYYFNLQERTTHALDISTPIGSILVDGDEVYYGGDRVYTLFGSYESDPARKSIYSLFKYRKKILYHDITGLATLDGQYLLQQTDLKGGTQYNIESFSQYPEGNLYATLRIIQPIEDIFDLVSVKDDGRKLSFSTEIRTHKLLDSTKFLVLPGFEHGTRYSVIRPFTGAGLIQNNTPIKGTYHGADFKIQTITFLGLTGNLAELVYTGDNFNRMVKVTVDLEKALAIKREDLSFAGEMCGGASDICPVWNPVLHKKLIERGKRR